jgi:hypothetical protein
MSETKTGTADNPTKTTVPAEYYTGSENGPLHLVVSVDLSALGVGSRFDYDTVIHVEGGEITMTFFPPDDDEGWHRLHEVGEW